MKKFDIRLFSLALCFLTPAFSVQAQATYPQHAVRVLVGFSPGGPTDIVARLVAKHLAEDMKQPFVVDNKGGAAGNIATAETAKAAPDGYTTMVASVNITINPAMMEGITFDSRKDIRPVRAVAVGPTVLVVRPDFPARTYAEFVAELRKSPNKYSAAAQGSSPLVATELFSQLTHTKITPVSYRGAAPAMLDLMAGTVDLSFATLGSVMSQLKSGKVRALAIAAPVRNKQLPDVPTFAESGLRDFSFDSWTGVFVPAKTPDAVVAALAASLDKLVLQPDYASQLEGAGMVPLKDSSPAKLTEVIDKETKLYAKLGQVLKERSLVPKD